MTETKRNPTKQITNVFSIDVEDYYQVSALAPSVSRIDWDKYPSRVEQNTVRILELLDLRKVKGTFFVLGWVAEKHPELIKEIDRRGHEIACHGYSHKLIYNQTPIEFKQETRRAKDHLEQLIGKQVFGYRAASYSITHQSLWALDILIEFGFVYDSSVFPVRHDRYGIPDAPRFPHVAERGDSGSIIEFPVSTLNFGVYRLPVGGGGYFRIFPYWLSSNAIRIINKYEQEPAMFYLHPWEIDPDQPKIPCSALSRFRHYHNLNQCFQRLDRLLSTQEFGCTMDVLADYRKPLTRFRYTSTGILESGNN